MYSFEFNDLDIIKNLSFNKIEKRLKEIDICLSDIDSFVKEFDNRMAKDIISFHVNVGLNPQKFFEIFYCNNITQINKYLLKELEIDDSLFVKNYETGNLLITLIFKEKEVIELNLLNKEYRFLIKNDKNTKIKELKSTLLELDNSLNELNEIMDDEDKIKKMYNISILNIFNKNKILNDARLDLTSKINEIKENIIAKNLELENTYSSKSIYDEKIEDLIKRLNSFDYNEKRA